jgi:hypothetical protein
MTVKITLNEEMCEEIFRQILKIDFEEHCLWTHDQGWRSGQAAFAPEWDASDEYDQKLAEAYKVMLNHYYNELEAKEIIEKAEKLTYEDQINVD